MIGSTDSFVLRQYLRHYMLARHSIEFCLNESKILCFHSIHQNRSDSILFIFLGGLVRVGSVFHQLRKFLVGISDLTKTLFASAQDNIVIRRFFIWKVSMKKKNKKKKS